MFSKALAHYPQFRYSEGIKKLWNPILKKQFINRPEERVRLALIDYFTLSAGFSPHRIAFESPVKLNNAKNTSRTDIICYDKDFKPLLLAECKAPEIKLDEKAAIQVARYNQQVEAPYLLVSNGLLDFWFQSRQDEVSNLNEVPPMFAEQNKRDRDFSYWQQRAFAGEKLTPEARLFAAEACNRMFGDARQPVKFLLFDDFSPEYALGHYYRIYSFREKVKIALSLSANPFGGTRLNGVLNQSGANTAFVTASLNLVAESVKANAEVHSARGTKTIDFSKQARFSFDTDTTELAKNVQQLLLNYV